MELLSISIGFETRKEQKKVEEFLDAEFGIRIYFKEDIEEEDTKEEKCWTEFDILGCEPSDIEKFLTAIDERCL